MSENKILFTPFADFGSDENKYLLEINTLGCGKCKLDRSNFLNTIGSSIQKYFDNDYPSGGIYLIDGSWGSGKTWCINVLEKKFKTQNTVNWLNYSSFHYLSEAELFFDMWMSLNTTFYEKINRGGMSRDELYKKAAPFIRFGGSVAKLFEKNINLLVTKDKQDDKKAELLHYRDKFTSFDIKIPTIIVIDDLDRIDSQKLWRIFSLLSLFENQKNILFVLVGSSNYLENIIEKQYNIPFEGENFLAKFINKRFHIPSESFISIFSREYDIIENNMASYFGKKYLFDVYSYRDLKLNYIEKFENILSDTNLSNFINTSTENANYIVFWFYLFVEIKLHHSYIWKQFINFYMDWLGDGIGNPIDDILECISIFNSKLPPKITNIAEFAEYQKKLEIFAYLIVTNNRNFYKENQSSRVNPPFWLITNCLTNGKYHGSNGDIPLSINLIAKITEFSTIEDKDSADYFLISQDLSVKPVLYKLIQQLDI
jgi:hypothetical protein